LTVKYPTIAPAIKEITNIIFSRNKGESLCTNNPNKIILIKY